MDSPSRRFIVTSSPHVRSEDSTHSIMLDVLIALLPAMVVGIFTFGFRALTLMAISTASCIFFEWLYCRLLKKPQPVGDLSAAVTGVLLAFNLPVSVPIWLPIVGAAFAIILTKQLYGGIGKNIFNPALAARVFLLLSWPVYMTAFTTPHTALPLLANVDAVTSATPLTQLKEGILQSLSVSQLFFGQIGGCLGETSALALLAGGVYLLIRRVISYRIPVTYLATVAVLALLFPRGGQGAIDYMLVALTSGGLLLGAIFMATDYTSSPVTPQGQFIYGVGCGLLTVFIRYFGAYPEGVSFSILVMNALVWMIDANFKPKRYGTSRRAKIRATFQAAFAKKEPEQKGAETK
ncbi:MAG: RnfABCDGE type electron transport complex subunit D [Clostridiaceae bacterium]|nr:RnfABCDGE type electron transport complex subunit D [Clostridiaceae bacterium]